MISSLLEVGQNIAVLDYVEPSVKGTKWGIGGTCVTVGCIPKKLMHQAALLGTAVKDAQKYGWQIPRALTSSPVVFAWCHHVVFFDRNVKYLNIKGSLVDEHTVKGVCCVYLLFLLPVLYIHGAIQHGITSDVIFWLKEVPRFKNLNFSPLVLCVLQQMAGLVTDYMEAYGTKFSRRMSDCVFLCLTIGRASETKSLNLEKVGVKLSKESGKIIVAADESISVPNIYAFVDIGECCPELTPTAVKTGKLLQTRPMMFTPLEYGCVGLSEEEVYHAFYKLLEFTVAERCQHYIKVVCERDGGQRILGLHFTSSNAGEVTQGFAMGFQCGATLTYLTHLELTKVYVSKRSGLDATVTGC
uniref:Thioredoxin reductase 2 n=1 Tax=Oncorhynchus kisutch TaxID=8019 RepID=A0A8C7F7W1_ONCKI